MADALNALTNNAVFALAIALAMACIFPSHWAPWCDLDNLFKSGLRSFLRTRDGRWNVREAAWSEACIERISILKYAAGGLVLILLLPLNSLTGSSWFVDELWRLLEALRHGITRAIGERELFFHSHAWRDAPYELWEICVFLWVFPLMGAWIRRDYVQLAAKTKADAERNVKTGQRLTKFVGLLSAIGLMFLVIVQAPRYRVLVELLVVATLGLADLYFCYRWRALGKMSEALKYLEVFWIVDFGALIGFASLLLFLEMTAFSYRSHWSSAFVAGASALNLLFANTASLVIRGIQDYRGNLEFSAAKVDGR